MKINIILFVVSCLCSAGLLEGAYRLYLYQEVPERFSYDDSGEIGVFDKNHWDYSEAYGYGYPKNAVIHHTALKERVVTSCTEINVINDRGNIGPINGNYKDAKFKVLIFGDSWSAFTQSNVTWTDIFEKDLEQKLGVEVEVVNFSRDGYGILQMFDMAADLVGDWKPDLTIFAFITNDLARVRTWRIPIIKNGVVDRVVTSFTPRSQMKLEDTYDSYLVHKDASKDWCKKSLGSKEPDEVKNAIYKKYQRAQRVGGKKTSSLFTLKHSYLFSRFLHGNPFEGNEGIFSFPIIEYSDYAEDSRLMSNIERLASTSSRKILFHMAYYPEVLENKEYITTNKEKSLLDSLLRVTNYEVIETLSNIETPLVDPKKMNSSPTNYHPSLWGMELYSSVLINGLYN